MAALTAARNVPRYGTNGIPDAYEFPVADNVKIFPGAAIVLNGGYAAPATTATGLVAVGLYRGSKVLDNTVVGHAAGAFKVPVDAGAFWFNTGATADAIAQANVGADCYFSDDNTVNLTTATSSRSRAGVIAGIDGNGLTLVQIGLGV